jgi:hypothetical protein
MGMLRLAIEDGCALPAANLSARASASTDCLVDFISGIMARGAEARNWPAGTKMTGDKCL